MQRWTHEGIVYYRFESLARLGVAHGVFTRIGGHSRPPYHSLNVGRAVGDDMEAVEANHRAIYRALRLEGSQVTAAEQVHGNRVARVRAGDGGSVIQAADALISDLPRRFLMLRFADCVPVLLYDRRRSAVGLAHAGWRGTMANIAGLTVRAMVRAFGTDPADLIAGLGPAIGPCCYQVGREVIAAVQETFPTTLGLLQEQRDGTARLDLIRANAWQLAQAGVAHCEIAPFCTSCRVDEFYSHRAEGGRTGRFAVLLGLGDL